MPTPLMVLLLQELLKHLLSLNKLVKQLSPGSHYFSHIGGSGGCCGCPLQLASKLLEVLRVP
jgi:hypothetical protein